MARTIEILAYAAGILDGEGCIGIVRHVSTVKGKKYTGYWAQVTVANTNEVLSQWLKMHWGGLIQRKHQSPKWKPRFDWRITNTRAIEFLIEIRPFILLKQAQADLAIGLRDIKKRKLMSAEGRRTLDGKFSGGAQWHIAPEVWQELENTKQQMHKLNRKGLLQ